MSKPTAQDEEYYVDYDLDFLQSILKTSSFALTKIKNQDSAFAKDLRNQVDTIDRVVKRRLRYQQESENWILSLINK